MWTTILILLAIALITLLFSPREVEHYAPDGVPLVDEKLFSRLVTLWKPDDKAFDTLTKSLDEKEKASDKHQQAIICAFDKDPKTNRDFYTWKDDPVWNLAKGNWGDDLYEQMKCPVTPAYANSDLVAAIRCATDLKDYDAVADIRTGQKGPEKYLREKGAPCEGYFDYTDTPDPTFNIKK